MGVLSIRQTENVIERWVGRDQPTKNNCNTIGFSIRETPDPAFLVGLSYHDYHQQVGWMSHQNKKKQWIRTKKLLITTKEGHHIFTQASDRAPLLPFQDSSCMTGCSLRSYFFPISSCQRTSPSLPCPLSLSLGQLLKLYLHTRSHSCHNSNCPLWTRQ